MGIGLPPPFLSNWQGGPFLDVKISTIGILKVGLSPHHLHQADGRFEANERFWKKPGEVYFHRKRMADVSEI